MLRYVIFESNHIQLFCKISQNSLENTKGLSFFIFIFNSNFLNPFHVSVVSIPPENRVCKWNAGVKWAKKRHYSWDLVNFSRTTVLHNKNNKQLVTNLNPTCRLFSIIAVLKWSEFIQLEILTLQAPTPQNGQTHSNNSSATSNLGLKNIWNEWVIFTPNPCGLAAQKPSAVIFSFIASPENSYF